MSGVVKASSLMLYSLGLWVEDPDRADPINRNSLRSAYEVALGSWRDACRALGVPIAHTWEEANPVPAELLHRWKLNDQTRCGTRVELDGEQFIIVHIDALEGSLERFKVETDRSSLPADEEILRRMRAGDSSWLKEVWASHRARPMSQAEQMREYADRVFGLMLAPAARIELDIKQDL